MTEVLNRKYTPPDNSEGEKQQETERKSQEYLKLAKENPHKLTEEIKKNPKTEPLLRQILGDAEYERIKDLNPNKLSEDKDIAKMQGEIYSFVDINPETDRNPTKDKFIKGLVDSIIVGNAELAMKIIETKGAILKNMIQEIFSWEGLKNIAEGFGKSVMELFSGDAYKTGKSLGELGLITVGSGAGGFVLKRLGKGAMKTGEKVAIKTEKETIVSQGLQKGGKGVEVLGKVVQAPYNIAEAGVKKAGGAIKNVAKGTSETIGNMPSVQKVTEPLKRVISESKERLSEGSRRVMETTKERAKEVLALASVPILVGSKDGAEGIGKLRAQIGAVGDLSIDALKMEEKRRISESLYKRYSYIDTPANREFLGQLSPERILGEGQNGIVITHPTREGVVVKLAYPKALHDLGVEFTNHNRAFKILSDGNEINKIPDTIKIPEIIEHFSETKGYYSMERLPGQSLHTKFLRETFADNLKKDSKEFLDSLTDNQLKRRLIDVHRVSAEYIDLAIRNNSAEFTKDFLSTRLDYQQAKEYLKENGFVHPDFHGGNVMLDNNGNLYIIDFGDILKP